MTLTGENLKQSPSGNNSFTKDDDFTKYDNYIKAVVRSTMKCMKLPAIMEEDLISAGYIGLLEASRRYDIGCDNDFKTYAFLRVRGSIIDAVRRSTSLNRTGYKICKLLEAEEELREGLRRDNAGGIKDNSVPRENKSDNPRSGDKNNRQLVHSLEYLSHFVKLFNKFYEGKNPSFEDANYSTPEQLLLTEEKRTRVKKIIQRLPDSERHVIEQYYYMDRQFCEIARDNDGRSKSWVSKNHSSALRRLRKICLVEEI